jgi:hypothetical protein
MKNWKLATISAAALLLLVPAVKAQPTCPTGATPLSVLAGAWSYRAALVSPVPFPPLPVSYVAAGTFTASVGAAGGKLTSIQSSVLNGNTIRFESDYGASSYQGFANCGGVTLNFTFSTRAVLYDCWFQANRTILYCVSVTDEFPVVLHASRIDAPPFN